MQSINTHISTKMTVLKIRKALLVLLIILDKFQPKNVVNCYSLKSPLHTQFYGAVFCV